MRRCNRIFMTSVAAVAVATLLAPPSFAAKGDPLNAPGSDGSNGPATPGALCDRINVCTSDVLYNGEAYAGPGLLWRTNFSNLTIELWDLAKCTVIRSCPAPGAVSPSELTYMGGILYHYDYGTGLIYAIDPSTCQVIASCNAPGDDLGEGLTNDGTFLWRSDSSALIQFSPPTAVAGCSIVGRCPLPGGDAGDGLTMCNGQLVMLGYSGRLYTIDPSGCDVTGLCDLNAGASGNGLTGNRSDTVLADNMNGDLDRVDVGCDIPVPVEPRTWGGVKAIYR